MFPNLKAEMARKGVTQEDVAKVVGTSVSSVNRWLTGNGGLSLGTAFEIRDKIFPEFSIDYLFGPIVS
jgi:transcriptional regulator with XRE-family HTH domain